MRRPRHATNLPGSVNGAPTRIQERLDAVRSRIADAAVRSGRAPGAVLLVAASKTVPHEVLAEGVACGLTDFGENRVQEAIPKIEALRGLAVRWHLIGHLQRNKAGRAVECFDRVHGLDGLELARSLSARAAAAGKRLPALVEVNVSGEATKHGVAPGDLERLLAGLRELPGLAVDGLMTLARPVERAEDARGDFARLRELRDRCGRASGMALPELSMGMSGDFEVAVEEGATMVRIGSALFGPRG